MLKNRPFLMVLTGAGLAFFLWVLVMAFQSAPPPSAKVPSVGAGPTAGGTEEFRVTPPEILGARRSDGGLTLNGIGTSGGSVTLTRNEVELGTASIDRSGNWALNVALAVVTEQTAFDLVMTTADGLRVRSDQSLFVMDDMSANDQETAPGRALIVLTESGSNSRVLQHPYNNLPTKNGFTIEAIDYDNSGGAIFSGASVRKGKVKIYANHNLIGESSVDASARWNLIFGSTLPLGSYTITAELVPDIGEPVSLTVQFSRMLPLFEDEGSPRVAVKVESDNIQIGRALHGGGYQYTAIYGQDALLDPN